MIKIGAPDFTDPVPVSEIIDSHFLELINGNYPIVQEPDNNSLVSVWPSVPVLSTDITLNAAALSAVSDMFAAARGSVSGSFYVSSGYRDYAEQQRLYDASADKSYVQPPGHSEHESGLAADIMVKGVSQAEMSATQDGQWLAKNSWRFGLILRYPEGKRDVTGISYEPWHFRYIGQPHAWYCYQNDLSFEEYVQFLKDNSGYQVTIGGVTYSVLYEMPINGIIYAPSGQDYSVSGDNTGGYIVTGWEGK